MANVKETPNRESGKARDGVFRQKNDQIFKKRLLNEVDRHAKSAQFLRGFPSLHQSVWFTIRELTCWVGGTQLSTLEWERA